MEDGLVLPVMDGSLCDFDTEAVAVGIAAERSARHATLEHGDRTGRPEVDRVVEIGVARGSARTTTQADGASLVRLE